MCAALCGVWPVACSFVFMLFTIVALTVFYFFFSWGGGEAKGVDAKGEFFIGDKKGFLFFASEFSEGRVLKGTVIFSEERH